MVCSAKTKKNKVLQPLLSSTLSLEAPAYLIDLMHDKNTEIRKVCDNTLDIIAVSQTHTGEACMAQ